MDSIRCCQNWIDNDHKQRDRASNQRIYEKTPIEIIDRENEMIRHRFKIKTDSNRAAVGIIALIGILIVLWIAAANFVNNISLFSASYMKLLLLLVILPAILVTLVKATLIEPGNTSKGIQIISLISIWCLIVVFFLLVSLFVSAPTPLSSYEVIEASVIAGCTFFLLTLAADSTSVVIRRHLKW